MLFFCGLSTGSLSFGGVKGGTVKTVLLIGSCFVLVSDFSIVGNGIVGAIFFSSRVFASASFKDFNGEMITGTVLGAGDLAVVLVSADKTFVQGKAQAVLTAKNKTQFRIR